MKRILFILGITAALWLSTVMTLQSVGSSTLQMANPSANASANYRILCYEAQTSQPFADFMVQENGIGIETKALPKDCNYYVALKEVHIQKAGKGKVSPAFTVYETSYTTSTNPLPTSLPAGGGNIIVDSGHHLTLFDISASFGWRPHPESTVLTKMIFLDALSKASLALYDATEGQMAFGPVEIYEGGENWLESDIKILPSNSLWPSSFVGGIVNSEINFSNTLTATTYLPASIYLGRNFDGHAGYTTDELSAQWSGVPTGTQTILHEWSHYAYFLYDQYEQFQVSGSTISGKYCTWDDLPKTTNPLAASIMAYHYTAQEFSHDVVHANEIATLPNSCSTNANAMIYGSNVSDWEILSTWEDILQISTVDALKKPTKLQPDPNIGIVADLFNKTPTEQPVAPALYIPIINSGRALSYGEPIAEFEWSNPPASPINNKLHSEVYLLKGEALMPQRILPQGEYFFHDSAQLEGQIRLLDMEANDRVRSHFFVGQGVLQETGYLQPLTQTPLSSQPSPWAYEFDHRFTQNGVYVTDLSITLTSTLNAPVSVTVCALMENGCDIWEPVEMQSVGSNLWSADFSTSSTNSAFSLKEMPRYLVLYLLSEEYGPEFPIIQWIKVGGGIGPGHIDGTAPLVDSEVALNFIGNDVIDVGLNCVINSWSYTLSHANFRQAASFGDGLLTPAYRVRFMFPESNTNPDILCPDTNSSNDLAVESKDLWIRIGYKQVDLERFGLDEDSIDLTVIYFDPAVGNWISMERAIINRELNFVAAPIRADGIYAIAYR